MFKKSLFRCCRKLLFGILLLVIIAFAAFTIHNLNIAKQNTADLYNHPFTVSLSSLEINVQITKIHNAMKDFVLSTTTEERKGYLAKVEDSERITHTHIALIKERFLGDPARINEFENLFSESKRIREKVITLIENGERDKAMAITKNEGALHLQKLENKLHEFVIFAEQKADNFYAKSIETKKKSLFTLYVFIFTAIGLSFAISTVHRRS